LLLKRSARYVMVQWGFTYLLSGLSLALMLVLARTPGHGRCWELIAYTQIRGGIPVRSGE
jgi:hypothetical protein